MNAAGTIAEIGNRTNSEPRSELVATLVYRNGHMIYDSVNVPAAAISRTYGLIETLAA